MTKAHYSLTKRQMEIRPPELLSKAGKGFVSLRFSVFTGSIQENPAVYFEEFFGFPAENEAYQKALFRSEFSTSKDSTKCALVQNGPKIDFTIAPEGMEPGQYPLAPGDNKNPDLTHPGFGVIPIASTMVTCFREAVERVVTQFDDIRRLAIGMHCLWNGGSKHAAYRKLSELLPHLQLDEEQSSDLLFRVNRTRSIPVGVNSFVVNRLAEWSAPGLAVQYRVNDVDAMTSVDVAASLKTDVNTAQSSELSALDAEGIRQITKTLIEFSEEIAEKGDVP